jgi:hypothetical protein
MLHTSSDGILLHNVIWGWLDNVNKTLFEAAKSCGHQNAKGDVFMTPEELGCFLDVPDGDDAAQVRRQKIYVALAFAMLEPESRAPLVAQLLNRFPEAAVGLGLLPQPPQTQDQSQSVPVQPSEAASAATVEPKSLPTCSETILSVPPAPLDCWASHVDHFIASTEELRSASERFAKQAADLSGIEALSAFAESGAIRDMLAALDIDRRQILEQSGQVLRSLTSPCANAAETSCELKRLVEQVHTKPPETVTDLTIVARTMREKADALVSRAQSARKEVRLLKPEAGELSILLQLPDPSPDAPGETASPCKTLEAVSNQKRIVSELRQKVAAEALRRKDLLIADAETICKQYDLGSGASFKESLTVYTDLRTRINAAQDIEDIQECEHQLEDLKTKCRAAERFDHRKLASRLQKEPETFSVFLDLCNALVDQGAPEVAYLLLHVRQRVHQFEEIAEMPDRSLDLLLETACTAAANQLPLPIVWESLCTQPWLLSIEHDDIKSPDLLERIVVALIGAALSGQKEQASALLARLGAREISRQRFSEPLDEVLQTVLAQQSIRLATPDQLIRDHELENSLRESLIYEGGKYRHLQSGKAHHFARFETIHVFPALTALWQTVSADLRARRFKAAHEHVAHISVYDWYCDLVRKNDRPLEEHPHFSGKIRTFMQSVVTRLQDYVRYSRETWEGDGLTIAGTAFIKMLQQWAGNQKARTAVVNLVARTLATEATSSLRSRQFWQAISLCPTVLMRCPHFITWFRAQQEPTPDSQLEQILLGDLTVDRPTAETVQVLEVDAAWEHLCAVPASDGFTPDPEWRVKHQRDITDLAAQRHEVQTVKDTRLLAMYDACVEGSRFLAARHLLQQCGQRKAEERADIRSLVSGWVRSALERLSATRDRAYEVNSSESWRKECLDRSSRLEHVVREIKAERVPWSEALRSRVENAIKVVEFCVANMVSDFSELDALLKGLATGDAGAEPTVVGELSVDVVAEGARRQLLEAWGNCTTITGATLQCWVELFKRLAEQIVVLRDLTREESVKYISLGETTPLKAFATRFRRPITPFLNRVVRFYLLPGDGTEAGSPLTAIRDSVLCCEPRSEYHVILTTGCLNDTRLGVLKSEIGAHDYCIIDGDLIRQIMRAASPDMAIRQTMLKAADLQQSSPFRSEGFVDADRDLFAGRKMELGRLLRQGHWYLCGGRRIGKTSLLHAAQASLRTKGWKVTYLDMGYLSREGDPDVRVCQDIAGDQNWQIPQSVGDFRRTLIEALRTTRVAILLDEMDHYIMCSEEKHAPGEFPFMRCLRSVAQSHTKDGFRVIVAGFKRLYYEVQSSLNPIKDVSYPFRQFMTQLAFGQFEYAEAEELIETGLVHTLGIPLEQGVARAIFEKATGHPAFLQYFCQRLVQRFPPSRNSSESLRVRLRDVEDVYADGAQSSSSQAFISFVDQTLGLNLSALGRAVLLLMATSIGKTGDPRREFSVEETERMVSAYCRDVRTDNPTATDMNRTLEFLVMSGMLERDNALYRLAFPSYVDILYRLEEADQDRIWDLIREYNDVERGKII